ncbi:MAG: YncE family protein [Chloroflexi bacterium]|nr:YncE family protein [Chloroflexota bacterium]
MTVNHCTGELYVVNWYDDRFFVIDPTTQTVLHDLSIGTSMWDVVMDPTASLLYITDRGVDGVRVFNPATLVVSTTIPVGDDPWGIDITPDGRLIFVTNEDSHNVSVIDTATNSVILTIPLAADADPRDVDISADGAYAYVTSGAIAGNDVVYVIDVATLQLLPSIDVFPAQ